MDAAAAAVRAQAAVVQNEVTGRTADEVATVINRIGNLPTLRRQAASRQLLPDAAFGQYSLIIGDLLSLYDELGKGSGDDALFGGAVTLESLTRAKEALSRQRGLVAIVITAGRFEQRQLQDFLGAISQEEAHRRAFLAEVSRADRRFFDETVNSSVTERAFFLRQLVLIRATVGASLKGLDLTRGRQDDAQEWFKAASAVIDAMHRVEQRQMQAILTRSADLESSERGSAFLLAGAVGLIVVVVLLVTTGVAQSLVRPLRRLRSDALDVALRRLPEVVQRLRETASDAPPPEIAPIGIHTKDEIGEVARAFDEVHREAVRLASEEARLRSNINAIFVNLSRRSQTLVERQLALIERLEQGEENERRLADLFTLDHLATRMRRNSENLLVLAGQEAVAAAQRAGRADGRGARRAVGGGELRARRAAPAVGGRDRRAGGQRRGPPARRADRERAVVLPGRHQGLHLQQPHRRQRRDDLGDRPGHRHVAGGARPGQLAARRPAGGGRRRLAAHGPVRGRPAGDAARHPGAAPLPGLRRPHRDGAAAGEPHRADPRRVPRHADAARRRRR